MSSTFGQPQQRITKPERCISGLIVLPLPATGALIQCPRSRCSVVLNALWCALLEGN